MKKPLSRNSIIRSIDFSNWEKEFLNALENAHSQGWFSNLKDQVVIKPNLCMVASPKSGITTDLKLIECLIVFIKSLFPGANIRIVESDSFERGATEVFKRLGYEALKEKYEVSLINLSGEPSFEVELKDIPYTLKIPKVFFEDIFLISVALPKTHSYQKITGIYKNQFGCIPDKFKERYHQYLEEMLYILNNRYMIPDLSIIDGRIGMHGYGPIDGDRMEHGFLLLSNDATLADINCSWLMGFNPHKIPYLVYACKKNRIKINTVEKPAISLCKQYSFIPMWEYRVIRAKLKVTRATITLNNKGKRVVHIFFRLPSFIKERKLIPLYNHLKTKYFALRSNKKGVINRSGF